MSTVTCDVHITLHVLVVHYSSTYSNQSQIQIQILDLELSRFLTFYFCVLYKLLTALTIVILVDSLKRGQND